MKHYIVIAMNDDRKASPHFVAGESNLRAKLEELIFFEREFSKERDAEMDCYMIQVEDKGSITFEGDPPIYVYETYADPSVFDEQAFRTEWAVRGVGMGLPEAALHGARCYHTWFVERRPRLDQLTKGGAK